jgi:hypothetical protein
MEAKADHMDLSLAQPVAKYTPCACVRVCVHAQAVAPAATQANCQLYATAAWLSIGQYLAMHVAAVHVAMAYKP